jgi:hypothetical protein
VTKFNNTQVYSNKLNDFISRIPDKFCSWRRILSFYRLWFSMYLITLVRNIQILFLKLWNNGSDYVQVYWILNHSLRISLKHNQVLIDIYYIHSLAELILKSYIWPWLPTNIARSKQNMLEVYTWCLVQNCTLIRKYLQDIFLDLWCHSQ